MVGWSEWADGSGLGGSGGGNCCAAALAAMSANAAKAIEESERSRLCIPFEKSCYGYSIQRSLNEADGDPWVPLQFYSLGNFRRTSPGESRIPSGAEAPSILGALRTG